MLTIDDKPTTSVLGVKWNHRKTDELTVNIELKPLTKLTKRVALSKLEGIFDPLGMIAPIVMKGRMIIQEIYKRDKMLNLPKLVETWDRALPADLDKEFRFNDEHSQEIYAFADASKKGFGCAIYLRTICPTGVVTFQLICAK